MPPKRKVVEEDSSVDGSSGLSSPLSQGDLELEAEESKPAAAKKRKVGVAEKAVAPTSGKLARTSKGRTVKKEVKDEDEDEEDVKPTPKRQPRKKVAVKEEDEEVEAEAIGDLKPAPKKQPRKKAAVKKETAEADGDDTSIAKPAKAKRKTKEEKEAEAMPLAARTIGHKLFIGAHVSSAGGQYFFRIQLYSIMHDSPKTRILLSQSRSFN
jgi:AP endonuclease-1